MLIAHLSDFHIRPRGALAYGVSETNLFAEHAIHALLRLAPRPDCVIVSGDLTDCGLAEEYEILASLFARLPMPVFAVPGNHDRREPFRAAFAPGGYLPPDGYLNFAIDRGEVRIIGLDSLVAGESHGALAPDTLRFLAHALAERPDATTLVMLHHPPFETGIGHMDQVGLREGVAELEVILHAHPQVARVLCGHVHRSIQTMVGGRLCQIAPSVAHQVTLDLRTEAPSCFVLEPPEFLIHRVEGGRVVTHGAKVDRAPGPFPFVLPEDYPGRSPSAA